MSATVATGIRAAGFAERISPNWREYVSMLGTVVAVTGLATAFFVNATWWMIACFGLLSITSGVGWQTARSHAELNRLALSTRNLQASQIQLQQSETRLNASLTQIQAEQVSLTRNLGVLQTENRTLQRSNATMQTNNQNLERANQALRTSSNDLLQQKRDLQAQIQTLEKSLQSLTGQVRQLVQRDADMAKRLGTLQQNMQGIHSDETRIADSNSNLHENLAELHRLIQMQGTLSGQNSEHLEQQSTQLTKALRGLETKIKESVDQPDTLLEIEKRVKKAHQEWNSLQLKLTEVGAELDKKIELNKQLNAAIDAKLAKHTQ